MPDVLVVAGEASGDRHGADVVAALKRLRPDVRFFGMAGPKLAAEGVEAVHGAHEISVMGIAEVVPKIPRILEVMSDLVAAVRQRKPVCALLIDVPDFNLRLAKRLKRLGIPVVWFIAPMVWAWRPSRTKALAERTDEVLCILPFEEAFLRARGVNATYVGNPVVEQLPPPAEPGAFRRQLALDPERPTLAVLPGSRRSELNRLLPVMVEVSRRQRSLHPGLQVVVPVAPGISHDAVRASFGGDEVALIDGRAAEVVGASDVALVASGTATLEAGLMQRPVVVIYKVSGVTYAVGKALVKLPHFSLVNLLAEREVVPELLQGQVTPEAVVAALEPLWRGPARATCLEGLETVRAKLGAGGAAQRVAEALAKRLATP